MTRSVSNTGILIWMLALGPVVGYVTGVSNGSHESIPCPEGTRAVWTALAPSGAGEAGTRTLECQDSNGLVHGPHFNWSDGMLHGVSFWDEGEPVGTSVTFHDNRRIWVLSDHSRNRAQMAHWDDEGVKLYEGILDRSLVHAEALDVAPGLDSRSLDAVPGLEDEGEVRLAEAPELPAVSAR